MKPSYPIIDADGHVEESAVDWVARLPAKFRDVAPHFPPSDDGVRRFFVEGNQWPTVPHFYGSFGQPPRPRKGNRWTNRPGMGDPVQRLADMDIEGIDIAVLYGTYIGLGAFSIVEDPDLLSGLCRAYNEWLTEYCSANPDRLKGVAIVPVGAPDAAREARRAVEELGHVSLMILTNHHGKIPSDEVFFPIYEAAEGLGVPVSVHIISTNSVGVDRFDRFAFKHAYFSLDMMMAVGAIAAGGVMDRFPKLKVAFLEAGVGWVPFLIDRLHEHAEILPDQFPWLTADPAEHLKSDRVWYSFEPDESTVPWVAQTVGEERLVYASDYAHWDCSSPDSARIVWERTDLSESLKRKVLFENAARLFNLKAPVTA